MVHDYLNQISNDDGFYYIHWQMDSYNKWFCLNLVLHKSETDKNNKLADDLQQ